MGLIYRATFWIKVALVVYVGLGAARCRRDPVVNPSDTDNEGGETNAGNEALAQAKRPGPCPGKRDKSPYDFAFAVTGDSRGRPGGVYPFALRRVLDHVLEKGETTLVFFTGDMVQGGTKAPRLAKQLEVWKDIVAPYRNKGIEFLVTSGNHEIDDGTMFEQEPDRFGKPTRGALANQKVLLEAFPDLPRNGPEGGGLTYWVRKNEILFVVLDGYRPGKFNSVDSLWLGKVLSGPAAEPPPRRIFVVTHAPAFPGGGHTSDSLSNYNLDRQAVLAMGGAIWPWQPGSGGPRDVDVDFRKKRDDLWNVLTEHHVTALLVGHEHNLSAQRIDGVWQITSGALTSRLYPANTIPLEMYDGKPQNPKAGDTFWHGGDKLWGYVLVGIKGEIAEARFYGWTEGHEPIRLVKKIEL